MEQQSTYFEFQTIPMIAACNPLLSPSDKLIYASIYFLKNNKKGPCFASNEYLADYNQISLNAVEKSIKKLDDLGYITRNFKKIIIKEARGSLKAKYNTKRFIYIQNDRLWDIVQDLWNYAFPQKNETARNAWYLLKKELERHKKSINIEKIQQVILNMVSAHKKLWLNKGQFYGHPNAKIMGILKSNYYKEELKDISVDEDKKIKILSKINGDIKLSQFNKFYKFFPKKVSKGKAMTAWEKLCNKPKSKKPKFKELIIALKKQKKSDQWQDKKYIPHPSTWLNQKRWLDEIDGLNNKKNNFNQPQDDMERHFEEQENERCQ